MTREEAMDRLWDSIFIIAGAVAGFLLSIALHLSGWPAALTVYAGAIAGTLIRVVVVLRGSHA